MITGGRPDRTNVGRRLFKRCCKADVSSNQAGTVSFTVQNVTVPPADTGSGTFWGRLSRERRGVRLRPG